MLAQGSRIFPIHLLYILDDQKGGMAAGMWFIQNHRSANYPSPLVFNCKKETAFGTEFGFFYDTVELCYNNSGLYYKSC